MPAKIFLSCGQSHAWPGEKRIAKEIKKKLESLGYEVYVAQNTTTWKAVKNAILDELEDSEYYLFVDFKREELYRNGNPIPGNYHRGSLFTHQELALAMYLKMEWMGWREEGVLPYDGVIGTVLANCDTFSTARRRDVPTLIAQKVKADPKWNNNWKSTLSLGVPTGYDKVNSGNHWYQLKVVNNHCRKIAKNCFVVIEKIIDAGGNIVNEVALLAEWEAYKNIPGNVLFPGEEKNFTPFCILGSDPSTARIITFHSTPSHQVNLSGPGTYEITCTVSADEFRSTSKAFRLTLGNRFQDVNLVEI